MTEKATVEEIRRRLEWDDPHVRTTIHLRVLLAEIERLRAIETAALGYAALFNVTAKLDSGNARWAANQPPELRRLLEAVREVST